MKKGSTLYFANSDYMYMKEVSNPEKHKDRSLVMCEQCVEKYLKHLLVTLKQEVNTTHNIDYIYREVCSVMPELEGYRAIVKELRTCYYDRNYENDSYYELTDEEFKDIFDKSLELIEKLKLACENSKDSLENK